MSRFIMSVIILGAANGFLEQRMSEATLHFHHYGLFLLVADDDALENSLRHCPEPYFFESSRFCAAIVLTRATSRRTTRTRAVFSSCPVARWKRRLNCSFFSLS